METEIITIGDEILIGQIVDTNSAWMAQKLNEEGFQVRQITSISDESEHIKNSLGEAGKRVRLVLITGGLGPTRDDRTKSAICEFFNTRLKEDPSVLENIAHLLGKRGIPLNQLNREQALVPETAVVLPNDMGTAPGLWMKKEQCIYIFMPGVPFEMKNLMEKEVLPKIRLEFQTSSILHHTIQIFGIAESVLAEKISQWENSLPETIKLAYLPSPEGIRLRLSMRGKNKGQLENIIKNKVQELSQIIPEYIIGFGEETLSLNLGKLLNERGKTVSTAESCTGGNIAHSLTSISGSSAYFKGSVVAYSNEVKIRILGVEKDILKKYGAVSQEVVESMARHSREILGTDYAIATSGIAGPTGGTEAKPVGMVWIAVAGADKVISKVYHFGNDRGRTIVRASQTALNMLRRFLIGET